MDPFDNNNNNNTYDSLIYEYAVMILDRNMNNDNYQYKVLSIDEIVLHQNEIINEVNICLNLPLTTIRILLNHFKWDVQNLLEKYFDSVDLDIFFKTANIINPFHKEEEEENEEPKINLNNLSAAAAAVEEETEEQCTICFTQMPNDSMYGLECGHRFCLLCWREYLTTKILTEACLGQMIVCAAPDCGIVIDDVTVQKLVTDESVKIKYQKFITKNFVECNKLLRWCPAIDCTYAIQVVSADKRGVRCKCGYQFCFDCGERWHYPLPCYLIKKWLTTRIDDAAQWLQTNTQNCPQCNVSIEKNGGCDHMTCRNINCGYEFCWLCLGAYKRHEHMKCFELREKNRQASERKRLSLLKYEKHFKMYTKNMSLMQMEEVEMLSLIENRFSKVEKFNQSHFDVRFLKYAVDVLLQCRQTLIYTYVFAYYLKQNNQTEIFKDNQNDLELATETLSDYLKIDIDADNFLNMKQKIQNKYKYCEQRRNVLLDHVYDGFDKAWWKFEEY